MDNRIDNFLKIAEEKLLNDINNSYLRNELSTLADELIVITEDEEVRAKLKAAFKEIELKRRKAAWDERFLGVIAGEKSPEVHLDEYTQLVSRGRSAGRTLTVPNQYTGQTYPTAVGIAPNPTWTTNTTLTEAELQKVKSMLSDREAQCTTP